MPSAPSDGGGTSILKRLLIDAVFAFIFVRYWSGIRLLFALIAAVFVFGIVRAAVLDFRAHGFGVDADLERIAVQTNVDDRWSRVFWTVRNNSDQTIGQVLITCQSNGQEQVIAPDGYIPPRQSASGVFENSFIGYDTTCKLTEAKSFKK
jgi:hypothetical protein